jgi:hypothetical protein
VLSFCVAIFTAYLLLSCCRVAVNAFRDIAAAALHRGVRGAETSLRVYRIRVRAQEICVNVVQLMILMVKVVQDEVGC